MAAGVMRSTATRFMTAMHISTGITGALRLELAGTAASVDTGARLAALVRRDERELALGHSAVMAAAAKCEAIRHADAPAWAAECAEAADTPVGVDIPAAAATSAGNLGIGESRQH